MLLADCSFRNPIATLSVSFSKLKTGNRNSKVLELIDAIVKGLSLLILQPQTASALGKRNRLETITGRNLDTIRCMAFCVTCFVCRTEMAERFEQRRFARFDFVDY